MYKFSFMRSSDPKFRNKTWPCGLQREPMHTSAPESKASFNVHLPSQKLYLRFEVPDRKIIFSNSSSTGILFFKMATDAILDFLNYRHVFTNKNCKILRTCDCCDKNPPNGSIKLCRCAIRGITCMDNFSI